MLHDMLADLPPDQAADESEFMARLGQFSLLNPAERAVVLAARTRSVRDQLALDLSLALPAVRNTALARD